MINEIIACYKKLSILILEEDVMEILFSLIADLNSKELLGTGIQYLTLGEKLSSIGTL